MVVVRVWGRGCWSDVTFLQHLNAVRWGVGGRSVQRMCFWVTNILKKQ